MNLQMLIYVILSVLWATTAYAVFAPSAKPTEERHESLEPETEIVPYR